METGLSPSSDIVTAPASTGRRAVDGRATDTTVDVRGNSLATDCMELLLSLWLLLSALAQLLSLSNTSALPAYSGIRQ